MEESRRVEHYLELFVNHATRGESSLTSQKRGESALGLRDQRRKHWFQLRRQKIGKHLRETMHQTIGGNA